MNTPAPVSQSRRRRGAASQRLVAQTLAADGWPYAESVGAGEHGRDITGTPGLSVEVKARRGLNLGAWLAQAVAQADDGEIPVLVVRLDGQGPASVDEWPAVLPFAVLRKILRLAGWGDPPDPCPPEHHKVVDADKFGVWLDSAVGRDWLACLACAALRAGRVVDAGAHATRCPHASGELEDGAA
ncbi:MAG: hypothetical protein ACRDXX_08285 [Stackebrandtia sp.]